MRLINLFFGFTFLFVPLFVLANDEIDKKYLTIADCVITFEDISLSGNCNGSTYAARIEIQSLNALDIEIRIISASFDSGFNQALNVNPGVWVAIISGIPFDETLTISAEETSGACTNTSNQTIVEPDLCSVCPISGTTSITVTNANDSGTGSLRQAIECANADPDLDLIYFELSGTFSSGSPGHEGTPLPIMEDDGIIIDGTIGGHEIIIDGSYITMMQPFPFTSSGFHITGNNIEIRGITITKFIHSGIYVSGGNNNLLSENYFFCNSARINLETGTNNDKIAPIITGANTDMIRGTGEFGDIIEVFAYTVRNCTVPMQNGECSSDFYLGTTTVNAGGEWQLVSPFQMLINPDDIISATATDVANNTSEFSDCVTACEVITATLSHNGPICEGEMVDITFNVNGGVPPYDVEMNGVMYDNIINGDIESITLMTTTTFTVTSVIDSEGCAAIFDLEQHPSITVVVGTPPNAGEDGTVSVCNNDAASIDISASLGGMSDIGGTWEDFNNDEIEEPIRYNFLGFDEGSYDFTYIVDNECGNDSAVVTVEVQDSTMINFEIESEYCHDVSSVSLVGEPTGGSFTSSTLTLIAGTQSYVFIPLDEDFRTHDLTYTYTDENGCTSSITKTFNIVPACAIICDEYGGKRYQYQMIVKITDVINPPDLSTLPGFEGVRPIEISLCETFQLWQVMGDVDPSGDGTLFTIEEKIAAVESQTDIEEGNAGANYILHTLSNKSINKSNSKTKKEHINKLLSTHIEKAKTSFVRQNDKVKVAILDTGIDTNDVCLMSYLSTNINWAIGARGYNFIGDDTDDIFDSIGHGTRIMERALNIVGQPLSTPSCHSGYVDDIEFLIGKIFDNERGTLWNLIEGLAFSRSEQVDIVTIAAGYIGEKSSILECLIGDLQSDCILVVTSAGNGDDSAIAINTDEISHFPSCLAFSSGFDNVVSVADTYGYNHALRGYSNRGSFSVDVAYPGHISGIIDNIDEISGTSYSAAGVTGIAALLKKDFPNASYKDIINAIYSSVTEVEELEVQTGGIANYESALEKLGMIMDNNIPELPPIQCESCICAGCEETLTISNEDIHYPSIFQSLNFIETESGTVLVQNRDVDNDIFDENIIFEAGEEITLKPGFEVELGAEFEARITSCEPNDLIEPTDREDATPRDITILSVQSNIIDIQPNPFQNTTTINYSITDTNEVFIFVSDITGKKVAQLVRGIKQVEGTYQLEFDGSNLSRGLYFLTFKAGNKIQTKKMALIRE